ncbi:MAG: hypothetical protein P4L55_05495 [Syntrophobacteraceae bacterium]|nr:hypothetical protein [Syntrophobacteraceae bacterium]
MKVNLGNFRGNITKTATIESNDPARPFEPLKLQGFVKAIVTMKPSGNVTFTGPAEGLSESVVDLEATTAPFHITNIDTNLSGNIDYSIQTVSDGTHYRLRVSNKIRKGSYSGYIRLKTDLTKIPYLLVRVMGVIKGAISATPETVMIGKMSADKPVCSGKVSVVSSSDKPFKITGLTYDKGLISVSQQRLENQNGFVLNIQPKMDGADPGSVRQAPLTVQTDAKPDGKADVLVIIFNNSSSQHTRRY